MAVFALQNLRQYADQLRMRSGAVLTARFAEPGDADALQGYFRALSPGSRYNRLMGAANELPQTQLDKFVRAGEGGSFSVLATIAVGGAEMIVGEARYAISLETAGFEIGLSVADGWQRQGIGTALLSNLECGATASGATHLFGDTLRSNDAMIGLALKSGFAFARSPYDWKQVRFEKPIQCGSGIPCVGARRAAAAIAAWAAV
jgi:GNAT superfamily N-acetyltransferase